MKARHLAARSLLLAIAGLLVLIATSPAVADGYSSRRLRDESLLDPSIHLPRTLYYPSAERDAVRSGDIPLKLGVDYRFAFRQKAMLLSVEVRPKLRRVIRLKVRF